MLSVHHSLLYRSMASNSSLSTAKRSGEERREWQATGGEVVVLM